MRFSFIFEPLLQPYVLAIPLVIELPGRCVEVLEVTWCWQGIRYMHSPPSAKGFLRMVMCLLGELNQHAAVQACVPKEPLSSRQGSVTRPACLTDLCPSVYWTDPV